MQPSQHRLRLLARLARLREVEAHKAARHLAQTQLTRQQLQARTLDGPIAYIDEAEGEKCNEMIAATCERPWKLWKKKVGMG